MISSGSPSRSATNAAFDVVFDVGQNKMFNKQLSYRWYETPLGCIYVYMYVYGYGMKDINLSSLRDTKTCSLTAKPHMDAFLASGSQFLGMIFFKPVWRLYYWRKEFCANQLRQFGKLQLNINSKYHILMFFYCQFLVDSCDPFAHVLLVCFVSFGPIASFHQWQWSNPAMCGKIDQPQAKHDDVIKWKHFPRYWPLCGEFTGHRWIPRTKASDAEFWCFLWSAPE